MTTILNIDIGHPFVEGCLVGDERKIPLCWYFRRRLTPEGGLPPPPILMRMDGRYGPSWEALIKELHHYGAMLIQRRWRDRVDR